MATKFNIRRLAAIFGIACGIALILSGPVHANSKPWRANNHTDQSVSVYFQAAGCEGVEPTCTHGRYSYICTMKTLKPGESTEYNFPVHTSNRSKIACTHDQKGWGAVTNEQEKDGIRFRVDEDNWEEEVEWYVDH